MGRRLKIPTSYSDSPWSIMVVWAQEPTNLEISGKIRKIRANYPANGYPVIRTCRKNSALIFGLPWVDLVGKGRSPVKFGHVCKIPVNSGKVPVTRER